MSIASDFALAEHRPTLPSDRQGRWTSYPRAVIPALDCRTPDAVYFKQVPPQEAA